MPNLLDALSDSENTIDLQDENLITPIHEFLEINPEKRLITIPESEQLFGVYGENKVEIKYFKCPRIILNDIDLYECYIFINYISASGKVGYIQADTVVLDETESYIIFTWELTRNVFDENIDTDIYFSISAKQYLEDKEPVFFTRKAKGNLYETVYAEEQITEQYADIILQLLANNETKVDLPVDEEGNLLVPKEGQTLLFREDGTTYYGTISVEGGTSFSVSAEDVTYDDTETEIGATNVQDAFGKLSATCTDLHTNDDIFLKHIVLSDSEEDETLLMTGEIDRLGIMSDTLMNYAETFSNSENVSISEDGSINFNTPGIYKLNVAMTIENVYSGFDLNISLNGELFNNHFVAKQGTHTYEIDKVVLISRPTTEKLFITDMSSEYLAEIINSVLRVSEPAFIGKVSNEQIEQVVEDYLAENKIEGGATAEQLAQIEQNKKDIGKLSATKVDEKYRYQTLYMKSPNGTVYSVKISDDGKLYVDGVVPDEDVPEDLLEGRLLAWNDEFETLNTDVWDYDLVHRNTEIQLYSTDSKNIYCENSILHLKALKDNPSADYEWSSGAITSRKGFAFHYGLIEAKLKYEPQVGCWPAFWSKGYHYWRDYPNETNMGLNWPECGEIDFVEYFHGMKYQPTVHYIKDDTGTSLSKSITGNGITNDGEWHIVGMEMTETELKFYLDRNLLGSLPREEFQDELYTPRHVLLNLALGGMGGTVSDELTETEYLIDWVRYYLPDSATEVIEPTEMTLDCGDSFELNVKKRRCLNTLFNVDYPLNYGALWSSSDETVATCYAGTVKTLKNGTTTITAIQPEGLTASTVLTVSDDAVNLTESIDLYVDSNYIDYGTSITIRTVVKPEWRTNTALTWESSDTSIATVENGVVTAVGSMGGNVTITCKSADGNVSTTVDFVCKSAEVTDNINTKGIVAKYTRNGWGNEAWTPDLETNATWNTANAKNQGFVFVSNKGYQQNLISDSNAYATAGRHVAGTNLFNNDGPFTVAIRVMVEAGVVANNGNLIDMWSSDKPKTNHTHFGMGAESIIFFMTNGVDGNNYINPRITTTGISEPETDTVTTFVFSKDAEQNVKFYRNGVLESTGVFNGGTATGATGIQLCIGNRTTTNVYYQALLAYNRVLSDAEVSELETALDEMYA